jgi:hypothetical protein
LFVIEYTFSITASQHYIGQNPVTGLYSASFYLDPNIPAFNSVLDGQTNIVLTSVWKSLDSSVTFLSGSKLYAHPPQLTTTYDSHKPYIINITGLPDTLNNNEQLFLRVNIVDALSPLSIVSKIPVILPTMTIRDTHYMIRDFVTNEIIIDVDSVYNSTRVSSDASGMYFKLDTSNLNPGKTYVIDIVTITGEDTRIFRDVSRGFKIVAT